ncbi:hypothetical protein VNO77_35264 [Canavalia gladiata]|uniref:Uncharacterized protein n=1 Tax=Canavalia gladiata TaxID=3824 RepID=A0AAN9KEH5_CANGL
MCDWRKRESADGKMLQLPTRENVIGDVRVNGCVCQLVNECSLVMGPFCVHKAVKEKRFRVMASLLGFFLNQSGKGLYALSRTEMDCTKRLPGLITTETFCIGVARRNGKMAPSLE